MTTRTQILGTGFVTGEKLVKNADLAKLMDTSDEWIRERSGIEQRYYVKAGTGTTDLALQAAEKAIADAKIDKHEIDYIVFATMTPDHYFPGCGGILQSRLGLGNVPALDIRQQCTGFIYGLQVSDALLRSGGAKTILLIGAEVHTGFMPWTQWDHLFGEGGEAPSDAERAWNSKFRDRTVLFGDAAGAAILRAHDGERGLLGFELHSDGSTFKDLYVPAVGFAQRPYVTPKDYAEGRHIPEMNGRSVFKQAVTRMPEVVKSLTARLGHKIEDLDLLIAHQANLRINEAVQKHLGLPDTKVFNNIQRYGNTTAATIPIALDECRKSGRVKEGDLVCFVGLGAGFHWGAALLRA
ncbi:MAG: ketoacyl-ACP synthase III [Deltaproteobacteria bacterium]|nr:ketoacyl-ACP synthase III [Deltaproteobacteria bacterium]